MKRLIILVILSLSVITNAGVYGNQSSSIYGIGSGAWNVPETSNSVFISDAQNLTTEYAKLAARGDMGTLSATNRRVLILMPGTYTGLAYAFPFVNYVDIIGMGDYSVILQHDSVATVCLSRAGFDVHIENVVAKNSSVTPAYWYYPTMPGQRVANTAKAKLVAPTFIENFATIGDWSTRLLSAGGIKQVVTTATATNAWRLFEGGSALQIGLPSGSSKYAFVFKDLGATGYLAQYSSFRLRYYVDYAGTTYNQFSDFYIDFYSQQIWGAGSDYNGYVRYRLEAGPGWHDVEWTPSMMKTVVASDGATEGSPAEFLGWDSNIKCVQLAMQTTATTPPAINVYFDSLEIRPTGRTKGAVVFTFDDGLPSTVTNGISVLSQYGYPCNFYVEVNNIAGNAATHCTWEQLRYAKAMGAVICPHNNGTYFDYTPNAVYNGGVALTATTTFANTTMDAGTYYYGARTSGTSFTTYPTISVRLPDDADPDTKVMTMDLGAVTGFSLNTNYVWTVNAEAADEFYLQSVVDAGVAGPRFTKEIAVNKDLVRHYCAEVKENLSRNGFSDGLDLFALPGGSTYLQSEDHYNAFLEYFSNIRGTARYRIAGENSGAGDELTSQISGTDYPAFSIWYPKNNKWSWATWGTLAAIQANIATAITNRELLVLYCHGIGAGATDSMSVANFNTLVGTTVKTAVDAGTLEVLTMKDVLQ